MWPKAKSRYCRTFIDVVIELFPAPVVTITLGFDVTGAADREVRYIKKCIHNQ